MTIRELSPKTIAGYENDLSHWFIFILIAKNTPTSKRSESGR